MKKVLLHFVIFVTIIVSSCSASSQQESRGFDTPTECAQAVFVALQKQDISAIEDCFAIPEMARLFDFRKFCERMGAITSYYPYMPSTTELGIAYNEASLRSSLYRQLVFSSTLLADRVYGEKVNSFTTSYTLNDDANAIISFLESPSALDGFSLLTLDLVVTPAVFPRTRKIYFSDQNTKNRVKQMSMWHVEDNQELILVANALNNLLGSDRIIIPLRFVQIDGKWLADPTDSNLRIILGVQSNNIIILLSEIQ